LKPSNLSYQIFNRNIAGLSWNASAQVKALALHGWLDNAASFSRIAPLMQSTSLCAIDMAGQGKSDFRSPDSTYDLDSELHDLYALSKLFSDGPINLVGHSRGAIVCALFAAIVPEKVNRMVLIDSIEPFPHQLKDLPNSLAESLRTNASLRRRSATAYASREEAVMARSQSMVPVSQQSAELFAERNLHKHDGGWAWSSDQRLKATSAYRITMEMREDFFSRIQAPTLVIEPEKGLLKLDSRFANAGAAIPDLTRKTVPGSHHCHMDDCPELVAELIEDWFST